MKLIKKLQFYSQRTKSLLGSQCWITWAIISNGFFFLFYTLECSL